MQGTSIDKPVDLLRAQCGGVMLECALTLPLLVLIVFGSVRLGIDLNKVHVAAEAARHGARIAASQSAAVLSCRNPSGVTQCSAVAGGASDEFLDDAARRSACEYLDEYGYDLEQWRVNVGISDPVAFGAYSMRTVSVQLVSNRASLGVHPSAHAVFALEGDCT